MASGANALTRAGRYITQPTGYRAFMPAALPPQPAVALAGELQGLLSSADRALGRLDGSVLTLPNPDLFVFMIVTVGDIQKLTGTTYAAANSLVSRLVTLDILSEMTGYARNRRRPRRHRRMSREDCHACCQPIELAGDADDDGAPLGVTVTRS